MNALTGTATLTRLALRRDRFSLPPGCSGWPASPRRRTAMLADGYRPQADLVEETAARGDAARAMRLLGLASGASVGGYAMIRDYLLLAVLAALMSTFAVVRHTRQNEETGRAELVGAAVVGRHAGLAAALIVTVGANARPGRCCWAWRCSRPASRPPARSRPGPRSPPSASRSPASPRSPPS